MKATQGVCRTNTFIAGEWGRNGKLSDNTGWTREQDRQKGFRRKAKSDETKAREASEKRYVKRSRVCDQCFQLKAVGTDRCGCE
jgi:glyoxylate carboligase